MDIKIKIGNRIKALRAIKGLSQSDLAIYASLDRSYIASVESELDKFMRNRRE